MADDKRKDAMALLQEDREAVNQKADALGRILDDLSKEVPRATALPALEELFHDLATTLLPRLNEHEQRLLSVGAAGLPNAAVETTALCAAHGRLREQAERLKGELTLSRYVAEPATAKVLWDLLAVGREVESCLRALAHRELLLLIQLKVRRRQRTPDV